MIITCLAAIFVVAGNHTVQAASDDGVTIGDVVNMTPRERIKYIHNEASRRGLELGIRHGDAVLNCLEKEFVEIKPKGDGNHIVPRGLTAAIRLVHRHNNNGGKARLAAEQISHFVDLVAERACGVSN